MSERKGEWLTNVAEEQAESLVAYLCHNWPGRVLEIRRFRKVDDEPREDHAGLVGIYEVERGEPGGCGGGIAWRHGDKTAK